MNKQQTFGFVEPDYPDQSSPLARFKLFHQANPWVFDHLFYLALRARAKGYRHFSIEALFNILRWERFTPTDDPLSDWKLNNNYKSFYSRLLMKTYPELDGFFYTRDSIADEEDDD